MTYQLKDSGERQEFSTGSRRDTQTGKGRYDLISPLFVELLAHHLEAGARKYGDRNWELGQPLMRYLDSAYRHLNRLHQGWTDEEHAIAAAWNIQAFIHTRELIRRGQLPQELDDWSPLVASLGEPS